MDINISADFERGEVYILLDHTITLSAFKDEEGVFSYKNFNKLDDEDYQDKFKKLARVVFEMEDL